ncbi:hypothetical protein BJ085DRAFT_40415 [Dimargaris cristalligena]|uniref:Uncharacterized protein n=1 Tax=Dimargaris cristalligena TaxID=215637 RepID=A0A4P9ZNK0_9FUNG|nr:hypothetical protein BJ085DRAFT_40415 [Dimargaris cristalligena]|eukprot:RKP34122.1 hypothetical protein BJ085DRAFT_40415 [Dimargaris cristalligena]
MTFAWQEFGGHITGRLESPNNEAFGADRADWVAATEIAQLLLAVHFFIANVPAEEVQDLYRGDLILAIFNEDFHGMWSNDIIEAHINQLVASVSAVLATAGQFAKLMELWSLKDSGPLIVPDLYAYTALLLLEFDDSGPEQDAEIARHIYYDCRYAGALGFKNAQKKSGGFVYPHRASSKTPKLAIRVRRSAAMKLLEANHLEVDEYLWPGNNVLLDQLHVTKRRRGFPSPQITLSQT